ncbi:Nesprin-2, partial [Manis pentadactyla]
FEGCRVPVGDTSHCNSRDSGGPTLGSSSSQTASRDPKRPSVLLQFPHSCSLPADFPTEQPSRRHFCLYSWRSWNSLMLNSTPSQPQSRSGAAGPGNSGGDTPVCTSGRALKGPLLNSRHSWPQSVSSSIRTRQETFMSMPQETLKGPY